ncbi:hypothetical protein K493DRAFT_18447 [Basidiobolus meristosporus CBS 931.73]|uniref:Uncharacterized protein n=1 Tax=Basidiobolus meristosporus CBS 931.73 TaxID=1314790 RepID=A0A1Y1Z9X8_9FUNG|nr:hypothetical protein K493DRAFT_18447 [Basidiobolus meristosporus CBS 931.73]|eukprot:ORY06595.1 hypothetical protein K493DRAFT_18447 [Basidiobolus meristosporus CBS 931.73]
MPVLILGYLCSPQPGVFQIRKPYIRWFLISGNDEATLVRNFRFWWHFWNIIGAGFLLGSCTFYLFSWDQAIYKQRALLDSEQLFDEWINDRQFR